MSLISDHCTPWVHTNAGCAASGHTNAGYPTDGGVQSSTSARTATWWTVQSISGSDIAVNDLFYMYHCWLSQFPNNSHSVLRYKFEILITFTEEIQMYCIHIDPSEL